MAKLLNDKVHEAIESAKPTDASMTFLPFYDSVIPESKKNMLAEAKVHDIIKEKVRGIKNRSQKEVEALTQHEVEQMEVMLIKYRPKKSQPSKLLNELQISNLVG